MCIGAWRNCSQQLRSSWWFNNVENGCGSRQFNEGILSIVNKHSYVNSKILWIIFCSTNMKRVLSSYVMQASRRTLVVWFFCFQKFGIFRISISILIFIQSLWKGSGFHMPLLASYISLFNLNRWFRLIYSIG